MVTCVEPRVVYYRPQDVTQQQLVDAEAVECVEKCARFHVYCAARLCEEDAAAFDNKINSENLTKCLQVRRGGGGRPAQLCTHEYNCCFVIK